MNELYQAWCVPTKQNTWEKARKIGKPSRLTICQEEAYFDRIDEPAPDKDRYYSWKVLPINETP